MSGAALKFENPIRDAISRIRFAPKSDNLLISSWDSVSGTILLGSTMWSSYHFWLFNNKSRFFAQSLRLYDVGNSALRLEASSEAALLDCCFQNESVAYSAGSDGFIRRYAIEMNFNHILNVVICSFNQG